MMLSGPDERFERTLKSPHTGGDEHSIVGIGAPSLNREKAAPSSPMAH